MCRPPSCTHRRDNGRSRRHGVCYVPIQELSLTNSMLLQQNARVTAASLLPPLSHLPPTMVLPGTRAKMAGTIANGDEASKKDVVGGKTE
jgi:hypothetical protein